MSFCLQNCESLLLTSLQFVIKEREISSEEIRFVIQKFNQVNVNEVAAENRNFVLSKHIMHFILLECLIEPVDATRDNPIPLGIRNEQPGHVCYKSLALNQGIKLWIDKGNDKTEFLLSNEETKKSSDCMEITNDDLQWFSNDTALSFARKSDVIFNLRASICCFLRGKKTTCASPVPVDPNAIVEIKEFLY